MDIVKFIEVIIAEQAKATNKEKMALLLERVIIALKQLHDQPLDERSAEVIATLKASHEVTVKALEAQLVDCAKDYCQIIKDQDDEMETLHIQLKEAQEIAQDALKGFNETAVKLPNSFETEVKGKKVKVNHGVFFNGKNYTAQDLVDDTDTVEELLAIGSVSITLID